MVLGTFQYMAPEQLEGKEADARTDIFALGAVIYEMATGKAAFSGNNRTSLITAILASEPPAMTSLQPLTPPALERVVKTCMAKDPDSPLAVGPGPEAPTGVDCGRRLAGRRASSSCRAAAQPGKDRMGL